ncbi:MAG: hypothetical protein JWR85_3711, partial [Marmoricola sp.]|nr:hypothetical protein [Marmoricola sp.]
MTIASPIFWKIETPVDFAIMTTRSGNTFRTPVNQNVMKHEFESSYSRPEEDRSPPASNLHNEHEHVPDLFGASQKTTQDAHSRTTSFVDRLEVAPQQEHQQNSKTDEKRKDDLPGARSYNDKTDEKRKNDLPGARSFNDGHMEEKAENDSAGTHHTTKLSMTDKEGSMYSTPPSLQDSSMGSHNHGHDAHTHTFNWPARPDEKPSNKQSEGTQIRSFVESGVYGHAAHTQHLNQLARPEEKPSTQRLEGIQLHSFVESERHEHAAHRNSLEPKFKPVDKRASLHAGDAAINQQVQKQMELDHSGVIKMQQATIQNLEKNLNDMHLKLTTHLASIDRRKETEDDRSSTPGPTLRDADYSDDYVLEQARPGPTHLLGHAGHHRGINPGDVLALLKKTGAVKPFSGDKPTITFGSWLATFESALKMLEVKQTTQQKEMVLRVLMEGRAQVEAKDCPEGTAEELIEHLHRRCDEGKDKLLYKVASMQQKPGEKVKTYGSRMREAVQALKSAGTIIPEASLVATFVNGLLGNLGQLVQASSPQTLIKAIDQAEAIEVLNKSHKAEAYQNNEFQRRPDSFQRRPDNYRTSNKPYCNYCRKGPHQESDCRQKMNDERLKKQGNFNKPREGTGYGGFNPKPAYKPSSQQNNNSLSKSAPTGVCYDFRNMGKCSRGENCRFSHSDDNGAKSRAGNNKRSEVMMIRPRQVVKAQANTMYDFGHIKQGKTFLATIPIRIPNHVTLSPCVVDSGSGISLIGTGTFEKMRSVGISAAYHGTGYTANGSSVTMSRQITLPLRLGNIQTPFILRFLVSANVDQDLILIGNDQLVPMGGIIDLNGGRLRISGIKEQVSLLRGHPVYPNFEDSGFQHASEIITGPLGAVVANLVDPTPSATNGIASAATQDTFKICSPGRGIQLWKPALVNNKRRATQVPNSNNDVLPTGTYHQGTSKSGQPTTVQVSELSISKNVSLVERKDEIVANSEDIRFPHSNSCTNYIRAHTIIQPHPEQPAPGCWFGFAKTSRFAAGVPIPTSDVANSQGFQDPIALAKVAIATQLISPTCDVDNSPGKLFPVALLSEGVILAPAHLDRASTMKRKTNVIQCRPLSGSVPGRDTT